MWAPVLEVLPGPAWFGTGAKLGYIVAVRLVETVLGNVFVWSGGVFYRYYEHPAERWGISAHADQGIAGGLMMIEGSIVTLAALAWLFLRWRPRERGAPAAPRAGRRPPHGDARGAVRPRGRAARQEVSAVRSNGLHHVDLVVTSILRSLPFYRELLEPLGWHASGGRGRARRDDLVHQRPRHATSACARPGPKASTTATGSASTTSPSRRRRAGMSTTRPSGSAAGRRDRERPRGVLVHARLLRGLLLRPGRDQARDPPRARPRGLSAFVVSARPRQRRLTWPLRSSRPARSEQHDVGGYGVHARRRRAHADPRERGVPAVRGRAGSSSAIIWARKRLGERERVRDCDSRSRPSAT